MKKHTYHFVCENHFDPKATNTCCVCEGRDDNPYGRGHCSRWHIIDGLPPNSQAGGK